MNMLPNSITHPLKRSISFIVLGCFIVLSSISMVMAQATNEYRSAQNGNWNTNSTWQRYNGTSWVSATSTPSSSDATITIRDGHIVTLSSSVSADQIVVASGGTLVLTSTLTLSNGTGTDLDVYGTVIHGPTAGGSGGAFTINSGATIVFHDNALYSLRVEGSRTVPTATWAASSTMEIRTWNSSGDYPANIAGQTFGHFKVGPFLDGGSSSGELLSAGGNFTVQGNFLVDNGGTNGRPVVINNSSNNTTVTVAGNYTQSSGTFELKRGSANTTLSIAGNFSLNGGTFDQRPENTSNSATVTVGGNLTVASSTTYDLEGAGAVGTLNVAGDFTIAGTLTESSSGSGSVTFNGTSMQTFTRSGTISNTVNFAVANGAYLQMASPTTTVTGSGTFNLNSGGRLGITSTAGITSSGSSGNIQVGGTRTFNTGANYLYNGSAAQVTGNGLPATVNNFEVDNSAGLTLTNSVSVNGVLSLTDGLIVSTSSNLLNILNTAPAAVTGASSSSYVNGLLRRSTAAGANTYLFPVGNASAYAPVSLDLKAGTLAGSLTASTTGSLHPQIASTDFYTDERVKRYWSLVVASGLATVDYDATFTWVSTDEEVDFDYTKANPAKYSASTWTYPDAGTRTATSLQAVDLTSFSDFAVGNNEDPATKIRVETAANGTGSVVSSQNLASGSSLTVYAIARDDANAFIRLETAATWSLSSKTGGVVNGDLVDNSDGSATLTGDLVGSAVINASKTDLTATPSGTITIIAGAADPFSSSIGASPTSINTSGSSTITVTVKDAAGNLISGASVFLSTDLGSLSSTGGTTNSSGVFTTSLSSTSVGTAEVSAWFGTNNTGSKIGEVDVTVVAGTADPDDSTIAANPTTMTTSGSSLITVTLNDVHGNPLTTGGNTVVMSTSLTGSSLTLVTDNTDGTYTASLTSTATGSATVSGYLGSVAPANLIGTAVVTITAGPPVLSMSTITANPTSIVPGGVSVITVQLRDQYGNPSPTAAVPLMVWADEGNLVPSTGQTNAQGQYVANYTSVVTGTKTITADFGQSTTVQTQLQVQQGYALGGTLYHDLNADRQRQSGEPVLEGWTIRMLSSMGSQELTTDANGGYAAEQLPPGNYQLSVITPEGWHVSEPYGQLYNVSLGAFNPYPMHTFGVWQESSISGWVMHDHNGNGIIETGDTPLEGWPVHLSNWTGIIATQYADADGFYRFEGLSPGNYLIRQPLPDGYIPSIPGDGSFYGYNRSLSSGTELTNQSFAVFEMITFEGTIQLGGAPAKGLAATSDIGDQLPEGIKIRGTWVPNLDPEEIMALSTPPNIQFEVEVDENGYFVSHSLIPGIWEITAILPEFWETTSQNPILIDISEGMEVGIQFNIAYNYDLAPEITRSSLAGTVYADSTGQRRWIANATTGVFEGGFAGRTMNLTGISERGEAYSRTTTTDATGFYRFADLPAGVFTVSMAPDSGETTTLPEHAAFHVRLHKDQHFGTPAFVGEAFDQVWPARDTLALVMRILLDSDFDGRGDLQVDLTGWGVAELEGHRLDERRNVRLVSAEFWGQDQTGREIRAIIPGLYRSRGFRDATTLSMELGVTLVIGSQVMYADALTEIHGFAETWPLRHVHLAGSTLPGTGIRDPFGRLLMRIVYMDMVPAFGLDFGIRPAGVGDVIVDGKDPHPRKDAVGQGALEGDLPTTFALGRNYPNPFNPVTNVVFDLPEQASVRIEVVDVLGRQVMSLAPQTISAGANKVISLDASRLSSGTYFYRVIAQGVTRMYVQGSSFTLVK